MSELSVKTSGKTSEAEAKTPSHPEVDMQFWETNGYYVLPGFFSSQQMEKVAQLSQKAWDERDAEVIVDRQIYSHEERRVRNYIDKLSADDRKLRFVLNDLYLRFPEIRELCLDERLVGVLRKLLGAEPVLCQSLNFNWGTQQGLHQDTLYLPPPDEEHLIAIWIALEDIDPNSGPLRYVPGSHRIPLFRFSSGRLRVIAAESGLWEDHIAKYMKEWGLKEQVNTAKKGDVFIWHAFLVHGGSPVGNQDLTRRSLVCHYYSLDDMRAQNARCDQEFSGHWLYRVPRIDL